MCEVTGADIGAVIDGMGSDPRIGRDFLRPGPGWGGSCLPKDTHALLNLAESSGSRFPLIRAAIDTNVRQHALIVEKVRHATGGRLAGRRIGILGLAFKAGTGDLRDSPAIRIAELLIAEGAELTAYDPGIPHPVPGATDRLRLVDSACAAAADASVLLVLTEWPEFLELDWEHIAAGMSGRVVVDSRNHVDPAVLRNVGLDCVRLGERGPDFPATDSAVRPGGTEPGDGALDLFRT